MKERVYIEFFGGVAEIVDNPNRKWWEFWKPKSVLELVNDGYDCHLATSPDSE